MYTCLHTCNSLQSEHFSAKHVKAKLSFETRPATVATLTSGEKYPASNGAVSVPLNAAIVAQYMNKDQICLEIGGGGSEYWYVNVVP